MSLKRVWSCALAVLAVSAGSARATVFFQDTFAYPDGVLTTTSSNNWVGHSSPGTEAVNVASGSAVVKTSGTEDVSRPTNVGLTPGATWYYGARLTVIDNRTVTTNMIGSDGYFMHFKEDGTTNLRGRLFVKPPNGTDQTKFTFGVTSSSSSPTAAAASWGTDLDYGASNVYTVIVGYTAADDNAGTTRDGFADLWVNPVNQSSTFVTDSTPNANVSSDLTDPMMSVALRQTNSANTNPDMLVDVVAAGDNFAQVLAALTNTLTNNADFDSDGDVDDDDFMTWQRGYGQSGLTSKLTGDANGSGTVDDADYAAWQSKFFGPPSVAAGAGVPEPGSAALAGLVALALAACGRRTRGA